MIINHRSLRTIFFLLCLQVYCVSCRKKQNLFFVENKSPNLRIVAHDKGGLVVEIFNDSNRTIIGCVEVYARVTDDNEQGEAEGTQTIKVECEPNNRQQFKIAWQKVKGPIFKEGTIGSEHIVTRNPEFCD